MTPISSSSSSSSVTDDVMGVVPWCVWVVTVITSHVLCPCVAAQEELTLNMAARRVSVAPINRQSNVQLRTMSWRNGSMFMPRPTIFEGSADKKRSTCEEERVEHVHMHHMQLAQHFFPSCICAAALPIIHLLEDLEVNKEGVAVAEVAEKVIWSCMVEEPQLFLRTFLEKLTNKDKREELVFLLRKLLYHIPELPAQTAHTIFNYLVGLIMFYVRSPTEGGQEAIGEALSILHQVVPSVHDIFFKDLKQTLKKEQCDPMLMITANVPSAKKLIVHDPGDTGIPSQCPIHEDTQFSQILSYSLDFFNIPDEEHSRYFLVDTKTNQMHNPTSYVRDFYFFRRSYYPEFTMVQMDPDEAAKTLQKQAFMLKFVEMGKVMFSASIVQSAPPQQIQNHVSFLTEELLKLPSFPRKALEADFGLWGDQWGKELRGLDMMHKYVWVKLMSNMFGTMSSTFTLAGDLPLFLNVLSGAVLVHCEDTAILRVCLATFINASRHFKQVFSTSGYLYIVPTLMKVYSNHQSNPVLCGAIEFAFRQFYTLHRKPFMLQMFGSLAPLLHMTEDPNVFDFTKVDTGALFQLLLALETETNDDLEILDLVEGEKPLMAMDFCYVEDPDTFQVIDAINMCVTVIAYACDSVRAMQMLTILEAVLPHYLKHIKKETNKQDSPGAAREEISVLSNIAISLRALIVSCETLTRNFSGPQRHLETVNSNLKPSANHSNHSPQGIFHDEHSEINSHFHYMEEGRRRHVTAEDEAELTLNEFRRPRNSLLCIVSYFFAHATARIRELRRMLADPTFRVPDLLDHKTQNRLAEVTHTLLKVAPYDPATMRCPGLQHYMLDMLPAIDWSNESARPALNLILRRMERLFSKLYKKPILMRHLDWEAASNLLKAIHKTLLKFNYIAHLPHLKTLISVCVNILLADDTLNVLPGDVHGGVPHRLEGANTSKVPPPPAFCSAVIKVTTMQMQALGELYTLEQICGGVAVFPTPEKTMNRLINLILPLCIRMGCGRRDTPKMRPFDINFAITCILNGLIPPHKHIVSTASSATKTQHLSVTDLGRSSTFSLHNRKPLPRENMLNVAFLGLKIMVVCFEKQLTAEWYRIAKYVRDLGHRLLGGIPLWRFLDFVVTVRTPLFLMLQPFIQYRMMKVRCETEQEYFLQHMVHQKMHGFNMPHPKCKGTTLIELATELRHLKEELASTTYETRPRTPTGQPDRTDSIRKSKIVRSSSIEDILEHQMASRLQNMGPLHGSKKYSKALLTQSSSQSLLRGLALGESESPVLRRKVSGRITAHEGSRILEKFMRKASIQEDDPPSENVGRESPSHLQASFLRSSSPRKLQRLQRQASIYQRPHITKQVTIIGTPPDESLLETDEDSEDARDTNGAESEDEGPSTPTKSGEDASPDHERAGPSIESADFDPRVHRLQRQDAKSRKTFKIKRHRSTIKGSIIRSATVKTPNLRAPAGRTQSSEPPVGSLERLETQPEEPAEGDSDAVQATNARTNGAARDPEVIIKPVRPSHTRYLPRSKSHDEGGGDVPVSAGTARGRIARQGARLMRSRSPSTSPSRIQPRAAVNMTSGMASPQRSGTHTQAYVTKCDSVESLGNEENAALLKPEDKSKSESSLLIYFDDKEEEEKDTCV